MLSENVGLVVKELFLKYGYDSTVSAKGYATTRFMQDWQLLFLFQHGLKPYHNFLDVGCGWLRLAYVLLPYLEPGRYFGIESTQMNLDIGHEWLERAGVKEKPNLLCNEHFAFDKFGTSFDFAFIHAVFTHLSHDQIADCLSKLKSVMKPTGVCYFTFYRSRKDADEKTVYKIAGEKELVYPLARLSLPYFRKLFRKLGLSWEYLGTQGHPSLQHVIEVRFGPGRQDGHFFRHIVRQRIRRLREAARVLLQA